MSNAHRIREFIKHFRKARSRHGIHSPFVYEFVEKGLKKGNRDATRGLILVTSRHKKLINKIIGYFKCYNILWLTNKNGEQETFITIKIEHDNQLRLKSEQFHFDRFDDYPQPDLILFDLQEPRDWLDAWQRYQPCLQPDTIILFTGIHHTREHTQAWEEILHTSKVKLSMDLYKIGLLFFREEFKEKQHFLIKASS